MNYVVFYFHLSFFSYILSLSLFMTQSWSEIHYRSTFWGQITIFCLNIFKNVIYHYFSLQFTWSFRNIYNMLISCLKTFLIINVEKRGTAQILFPFFGLTNILSFQDSLKNGKINRTAFTWNCFFFVLSNNFNQFNVSLLNKIKKLNWISCLIIT